MNSYERRRKRESRNTSSNTCEIATITSSDNGKGVNALGAGEYREIPLVAPFGLKWNPPNNKDIQLIKNWNNGKSIAAVGTIVDQELEPGEVELYSIGGASVKCNLSGDVLVESKGGASIETMSNGSVLVNGIVEITKNGEIKAKDFTSTVYGGVSYGL